MRHRIAGVRLSRTSAHRKALFSNLVAALFTHERIRTTDAKAKETRRLAERTITWARRVSDVLGQEAGSAVASTESARVVHAIRMARRVVRDRGAVLEAVRRAGAPLLRPPGRLHAHRQAAAAAGRRRADVAAGADARGGRRRPPRPRARATRPKKAPAKAEKAAKGRRPRPRAPKGPPRQPARRPRKPLAPRERAGVRASRSRAPFAGEGRADGRGRSEVASAQRGGPLPSGATVSPLPVEPSGLQGAGRPCANADTGAISS